MSRAIAQKCVAYTAATLGFAGVSLASASTTDLTAGVLMEKMEAGERVTYVEGVIEGLAYSRYERDNEHLEGAQKTSVGMNCIYNWFYEKPHALDLIYVAFGKFSAYPPAIIISNLIKPDCGG